MKTKLLLLTTLYITAFSLNAQTTYTYSGMGSWNDAGNWSPNIPPNTAQDELNNESNTFIINGDCDAGIVTSINASLDISGTFSTASFEATFAVTELNFTIPTINLNNGIFQVFTTKLKSINELTITGNGEVKNSYNGSGLLEGISISPGDNINTGGHIKFQNLNIHYLNIIKYC